MIFRGLPKLVRPDEPLDLALQRTKVHLEKKISQKEAGIGNSQRPKDDSEVAELEKMKVLMAGISAYQKEMDNWRSLTEGLQQLLLLLRANRLKPEETKEQRDSELEILESRVVKRKYAHDYLVKTVNEEGKKIEGEMVELKNKLQEDLNKKHRKSIKDEIAILQMLKQSIDSATGKKSLHEEQGIRNFSKLINAAALNLEAQAGFINSSWSAYALPGMTGAIVRTLQAAALEDLKYLHRGENVKLIHGLINNLHGSNNIRAYFFINAELIVNDFLKNLKNNKEQQMDSLLNLLRREAPVPPQCELRERVAQAIDILMNTLVSANHDALQGKLKEELTANTLPWAKERGWDERRMSALSNELITQCFNKERRFTSEVQVGGRGR